MNKLPVTVLSGFLGAGKTTILNSLLKNTEGIKFAVIVNDMSEINIDAELIKQGKSELSRTSESLVEMTNGCICCTLREDLLKEVSRLAKLGLYDHLIIESTGISEPLPVAQTFTFTDEAGTSLEKISDLYSLVTIVDGKNFLTDYYSQDDLKDRQLEAGEGDSRGLGDLLIEQIEFANLLVITKSDLISSEDLKKLTGVLKGLNPSAEIIVSNKGIFDFKNLLNKKRFNMEEMSKSPAWIRELNNIHTPETEEYGISSFVFRSRRPFHPARLLEILNSDTWKQVIRSKGYMWLATRQDFGCMWSQAGTSCKLEPAGKWMAAVEEVEWGLEDQDQIEEIKSMLSKYEYGDRRQEFVIIGQDLDKNLLEKEIEKALLTDQEFELGEIFWLSFEDSFPEWNFDLEP